MNYTEAQVKELLFLQRTYCREAYLNCFAGSEEDFANPFIADSILAAPEPLNFYQKKELPAKKPFKDKLVKDSLLAIRIKNAIHGMCLTPGYYDFRRKNDGFFDGKLYDELYLSDLARLSYREWLRVRNIGRKSVEAIDKYLNECGIILEK